MKSVRDRSVTPPLVSKWGMAQRMESVAPLGGVMLSASTARLVEGAATVGESELVQIKGASAPVPARRLLGMAERASNWRACRVESGRPVLEGVRCRGLAGERHRWPRRGGRRCRVTWHR